MARLGTASFSAGGGIGQLLKFKRSALSGSSVTAGSIHTASLTVLLQDLVAQASTRKPFVQLWLNTVRVKTSTSQVAVLNTAVFRLNIAFP